jgi:hypothetical protein
MSYSSGLRARTWSLVVLLFALNASAQAENLDSRLLGAWVPSTAECNQIFQSQAGERSFRQPVDAFTTAFVIGRREIRATTGSCQIGDASSAKGYMLISLSCNNSVGYIPLKARIKGHQRDPDHLWRRRGRPASRCDV